MKKRVRDFVQQQSYDDGDGEGEEVDSDGDEEEGDDDDGGGGEHFVYVPTGDRAM